MSDSQKVTVLLADEDALRRDGLALVLGENRDIDVVADCADGQTAFEKIRELVPDVAVLDLNLTGLHGIELVRRIRSEGLKTKVIILSGSTDDDIVREVVRAGADAYLLKNGPARHLTDAISYVRDGGLYFSPQLGRDGRDRRFLEEPPRVPAGGTCRESNGDRAHREGESDRPHRDGNGDHAFRDTVDRPRRESSGPHTADPGHFRERIRAEAPRDLRDRDYEIMTEMANGIRPILDRLDEIEGRVREMEEGAEPVPADPRGWLSDQLVDSLGGSGPTRDRSAGRESVRDVEARLPQLIEEAVTRRFQSMAGKLQEQIEEQHVRTLETFVKNIQVKLVQRVSVLEQNMQQQAEAMQQLREYNQRTEDNLSRLISGVDKLAQELPKRLAAARQVEIAESPVRSLRETNGTDKRAARLSGASKKKDLVPRIFWAAVALVALGAGYYEIQLKMAGAESAKVPATGKETQSAMAGALTAASKSAGAINSADTKTKLEAAKQYVERKEYATAEDIYKQVVATEPNNRDAIEGLASVLYREDKIEESTAVLDRLPRN